MTNITQIRQKIELYGSPTTKDLRKPHSSRWVGGVEWHGGGVAQTGMEMRNGLSHTHVQCIKIRRDTLGAGIPALDQTTQPRVPATGS